MDWIEEMRVAVRTETKKGVNRRQEILDAAAQCFAKSGYDATSMRDIAKHTDLLAGSLYYHFKSKEELLCAVHEEGVRRIKEKVLLAIAPRADAWMQLEQASVAYLESMLTESIYAQVVVSELPRRRPRKLRNILVAHRDDFENIFRHIIDELPLQPAVDRKYWRLSLMGMLAWTFVWYRPGNDTPANVAHHLVELLRRQTEA
jgi:AcrR family transcriptional regulator